MTGKLRRSRCPVFNEYHRQADLRGAIAGEEFVLHYQPIIDLQTQRVTGMEALVRWNHPLHGMIYQNKNKATLCQKITDLTDSFNGILLTNARKEKKTYITIFSK